MKNLAFVKRIALCLSLAMLLTLCPVLSLSAEEYVNEPEIDPITGLEFTLNNDGISYAVTGIGECEEYELVIPNSYNGLPVTVIGDNALYGYGLTDVVLPDTLKRIEHSALSANDLESIIIPEGVTYIGDYVFENCEFLMDITIPDSVTYIGFNAFWLIGYCMDPANYDEDGFIYIGNHLIDHALSYVDYDDCETKPTTYSVKEGTVSIGSIAFASVELVELSIPASVKGLGFHILGNCDETLESMTVSEDSEYLRVDGNCLIETQVGRINSTYGECTIPNDGSIRIIGEEAFCRSEGMTKLVIPDGVTTLEYFSLASCWDIEELYIPDSVVYIADTAFEGAENMVVYCEAESQPDTWSKYWNRTEATVVWGYDMSEFDPPETETEGTTEAEETTEVETEIANSDYVLISDSGLKGRFDKAAANVEYAYVGENGKEIVRLTLTAESNDPYISFTSEKTYSADEYKYVSLLVRANIQDTNSFFSVYYKTDGTDHNYIGSASGCTKYNKQTSWQFVTFDFSEQESWSGDISGLRLDFFDGEASASEGACDIAAVILSKSVDGLYDASYEAMMALCPPVQALTDFTDADLPYFSGNKNNTDVTAVNGNLVYTATGNSDPYAFFDYSDYADGNGLQKLTTDDFRYTVIRHRTSMNITHTQMEAYILTGDAQSLMEMIRIAETYTIHSGAAAYINTNTWRTAVIDLAEDDGLEENTALKYGWQGRGAFHGFRFDWCSSGTVDSYLEVSDLLLFDSLEQATAFSDALNTMSIVPVDLLPEPDPEPEPTPEITLVPGDASGDETVNVKDLVLLRRYIASYDYDLNASPVAVSAGADADGNGIIDIKDVVWVRKYLTTLDYDETATICPNGHVAGSIIETVTADATTYGYSLARCVNCGGEFRTGIQEILTPTVPFTATQITENVIEGGGDWLFYTADNNDAYFSGTNLMTSEELAEYANTMQQLNELCKAKGKTLQISIWPNKAQVYSDLVGLTPINEYKRVERLVNYVKANTDVNMIYPLAELIEMRPYFDVYHQCDTHWNNAGAYVGYQAMMKSLGYTVPDPLTLPMNLIRDTDSDYKNYVTNLHTSLLYAPKRDLIGLAGLNTADYPAQHNFVVTYRSEVTVTAHSESFGASYTYHTTSNGPIDKKIVLLSDAYRIMQQHYLEKDFTDCVSTHRMNINDADVISAIQASDIIVLSSVERLESDILSTAKQLISILSAE